MSRTSAVTGRLGVLSCLYLCHNEPCLSQVLLFFVFPSVLFRTHRRAIYMAVCNYDFLTEAWPVIFTDGGCVVSVILEESAGHTT